MHTIGILLCGRGIRSTNMADHQLEKLVDKYKSALDQLRVIAEDLGQYINPSVVMSQEDADLYRKLTSQGRADLYRRPNKIYS